MRRRNRQSFVDLILELVVWYDEMLKGINGEVGGLICCGVCYLFCSAFFFLMKMRRMGRFINGEGMKGL